MVSQKEIIEAFEQALNWANTQESDGYAEYWLDRKSSVAVNWSLIRQTIRRLETEGIAPPDGWQLVPIRPTWEIEYAIANARNLSAKESWADALASAPKQEVKS